MPYRLAPPPARLAGRQELLAELRRRLGTKGRAPRVVALHGLGGVGKTSVALAYAHRWKVAHDGLVWQLTAEDAATLSAGFGELAAQLGIHEIVDTTNPITQVHAALAAQDEPWLLILDNVTDYASIRDVLPPAGDGEVLLTTRSAYWPDDIALEVPVLDQRVAAEFLTEHTTGDSSAAADLARELGALPLALDQAASFLDATGHTLGEYLRLLRERRAELLSRGQPLGYAASVMSTWNVAFQRLQTTHPDAITLLRLLACCAPDTIPFRLMLMPPSPVPAPAAPIVGALLGDLFAIADAITELRRYSLVGRPVGGHVSVHRLVQAVTIDQLPSAERDVWRTTAAELVQAVLPTDATVRKSWPRYALLLPHARTLLSPGSQGTIRMVDYLGASGDYVTARLVQSEVYADARRRLGDEHPDTLSALTELARWTGHAGDATRARNMFAEILPVRRRVSGPEHPDTLTVLYQLCDWTGQTGDATRARDIAAELLPIRRRVSGDEHLDTLRIWTELGFWTGQLGDAARARDIYAELLPVRERVSGPEHSDTLSVRDQYARWIGEAGDPLRAKELCAALLPVYERIAGAEHPDTLWARTNLAWWTGEAGDPASARDQYRVLLPVRIRVSGPDHPATLTAWTNLAWWTAQAGDREAALQEYRELLPIRERVSGPEHPDTLRVQSQIAHWTAQPT
ncbi:tetratricopeptide repeat protein [Streptomyces mirabilis]|uniref:tetratricopeptide repeat protein n=1 Tax=Streptomyces mirabilis TaxID=68239 RepID=UPI0021BF6334|nr:tetratricopeptide repeat protein [Streptomyces mirabilis]MCT9106551.1 tetratricopeptide repeat protein [Streptomyces mirabilis]